MAAVLWFEHEGRFLAISLIRTEGTRGNLDIHTVREELDTHMFPPDWFTSGLPKRARVDEGWKIWAFGGEKRAKLRSILFYIYSGRRRHLSLGTESGGIWFRGSAISLSQGRILCQSETQRSLNDNVKREQWKERWRQANPSSNLQQELLHTTPGK